MTIFLFGLGIALSQFYIFASGLPQPAHFLIAASFVSSIFSSGKFFFFRRGDAALSALYYLMCYMAIVNFSFALAYMDTSFIVSTIYSFFGLMIFLQTRKIIFKSVFGAKSIIVFSAIGLLTLFGLAVFSIGDFRFFPRYNAFFNDPNQMAFWALCMAAILLVSMRSSSLFGVVIFSASLFIILKSASRSGLVGFSLLLFGYLVSLVSGGRGRKTFNILIFGLMAVIAVLIFSAVVYSFNSESVAFILGRVDSTDTSEQADVRGYTRLLEYPEYLLLGAGQGFDARFVADGKEIHSTPAGILFYYGIVGFSLLLVMLYSVTSRLRAYEKFIFLAPLLYSFSTFGFRTPIFWVYLGVFYAIAIKNSEDRKNLRI